MQLFFRQSDEKGGSFSWFSICGNGAPVPFYQGFANSEAYSGARIFAFSVSPEERFENFLIVFVVYTDSVIFNSDFPKIITSLLAGYVDHRRLCLVEFETVCDQV